MLKNAIFMALLSPFYGFWCNLAYWIWNGYRAEILTFGLQNMKENMINFLGLTSAHPKMSKSYPSFFMFSLKNLKKKILKKKWSKKFNFWLCYTNTNCFSWYFKLKTWCLKLFFYIRPFSGPFIGPRMQ